MDEGGIQGELAGALIEAVVSSDLMTPCESEEHQGVLLACVGTRADVSASALLGCITIGEISEDVDEAPVKEDN